MIVPLVWSLVVVITLLVSPLYTVEGPRDLECFIASATDGKDVWHGLGACYKAMIHINHDSSTDLFVIPTSLESIADVASGFAVATIVFCVSSLVCGIGRRWVSFLDNVQFIFALCGTVCGGIMLNAVLDATAAGSVRPRYGYSVTTQAGPGGWVLAVYPLILLASNKDDGDHTIKAVWEWVQKHYKSFGGAL